MKKLILIILALMVLLSACFMFSACQTETGGSSSRKSSNTTSVIVKTNKVEIIGETVVHSFYYYGDSTEIVFTYKNGSLDTAYLTRKCRDNSTAQMAYETFTNLNNHASEIMYEDIKLEGLTLTLKYTDFTMQDYKNLSKEDLKIYLENESLEP